MKDLEVIHSFKSQPICVNEAAFSNLSKKSFKTNEKVSKM